MAISLGSEEGDGRLSEQFRLTPEARGPWVEHAAHGGAPVGLIARAAESFGKADGMRLAGLSVAFFGPVPLGEVTIESELVKPGRKQRIVLVRLSSGGRVLLDARAVLLRRGSVDLPGQVLDPDRGRPMPGPERGREVDQARWAGGEGPAFHRTANTGLAIEGGPDRVGPVGSAWFRLASALVEGETPGGAQRAVAAADFGNGVAHPVPFGEFLFVNCDLSVSLAREPVGEWIGISSRTGIDPGGAGVTSTELFDREGWVGTASQTLFVDRV